MRIKGRIGPSNLAYFDCQVKGTDPAFSLPTTMIADTGASRTAILHKDASQLNLNYSHLELAGKVGGIGGSRTAYWLKGVTIGFASSEPANYEESLDRILVFRTWARTEKRKFELFRLPSVIGIDILAKYRITFPGRGIRDSDVFLDLEA